MGIPSKCFNCGKTVGQFLQAFIEATAGSSAPQDQKIYVDMEITKKEEEEEIVFDGEAETPAERFYDANKFRRFCCRRMLSCQPPHFPYVLEHQIPVNSRIVTKK